MLFKPALAPALALMVTLMSVPAGMARDPAARIDAAKRNRISTEDKAFDTETFPTKRADGLQEQRFDTGQPFEQTKAPIDQRRADIDLKESQDKTLITPERKTYEKLSYDPAGYDGQLADKFQTGDNPYQTSVADRFQNKLSEAEEDAPKTIVKKRTTFDSVNRFIFRRNRPEGDDLISTAGSATAQP